MYVVFCFLVSGYQYQRNRLPGKTSLRNVLQCVDRDVKLYTLTHSHCEESTCDSHVQLLP